MQSIDLLSAGVDTTANSAVYLMYELARNPDVQEKMYREILSVVGEPIPLVVDDLPKLPYLKGCVRETGRYRPVTAIIGRETSDEINLMGFWIPPKGKRCGVHQAPPTMTRAEVRRVLSGLEEDLGRLSFEHQELAQQIPQQQTNPSNPTATAELEGRLELLTERTETKTEHMSFPMLWSTAFHAL